MNLILPVYPLYLSPESFTSTAALAKPSTLQSSICKRYLYLKVSSEIGS